MRELFRQSFFTLVLLVFSLSTQANYPPVPEPFRYVSDYTRTLTAQEQQTLEQALSDYGRKTSSQIAVVLIPSTNGEEIALYSTNLYNRWGIGREKLNNGVLLLVAKEDRKLFITTGYGLEGALPDAIASSIIRNDITPYFKQGQYAQGIAKGLSSIIAATQGEYAPLNETEENTELSGLEIFLAIAFIILFLFIQNMRGYAYISSSQSDRIIRTTTNIGRSGGFGGSSNGGFSGGSSGGGFGGGRSGGGGAGGSW